MRETDVLVIGGGQAGLPPAISFAVTSWTTGLWTESLNQAVPGVAADGRDRSGERAVGQARDPAGQAQARP